MSKRILYVHGIEAIGGAERDLLALVKNLDRASWQPAVACPSSGSLREEIEKLRLPILPIDLPPWRKASSFLSRYKAVRDLRSLIQAFRPSLIHVNDLWWAPHTVRAVRNAVRVPVIAHVRQEILPVKARQYSLNHVAMVLAVSRQVQDALEAGGISPTSVRTIYSGVNVPPVEQPLDREALRARFGIPYNALLVGTVANLLPIKGYEVMLHALPAILAAVPVAHYLLIGKGDRSCENHLRELAEQLGIGGHVHFVGFQDPVYPYMAALDLYVQPSLREAFGLAVVEAMAMGKAVVATAAGGIPESVVDGSTGILVQPGNSKALSEAVGSLLQNPSQREQMGMRGRFRAQECFSLDTSVRQIEQVYRSVVGLVGTSFDANRH